MQFNRIRTVIICALLLISGQCIAQNKAKPQRLIVIMFDGFGESYYHSTEMPNLKKIASQGFYKKVSSMMPSVTNCNNASICCGVFPDKHGITGNSFLDMATGKEEYMESSDLLLAPTLFEKAKRYNVRSALFSSKKKSIALLAKGADIAITAENPGAEWIGNVGYAPANIYSAEINYWLFDAALYAIKNDTGLGCIYIHTTDYPMHTWPPEAAESKQHLQQIDKYIGKLMEAAPDAAILITADHDVHHKSLCIDLQKALEKKNCTIKIAISAERDKYLKHHRGFGGTSFVYLNAPADAKKVKTALLQLKGVEKVMTRAEAAKTYHLMPGRIGDLVVLGDANTVFGDLDTETEVLPDNYRTHGSVYEKDVPLFIYNAHNLPAKDYFKYNMNLTSWLYTTHL